MAPMTPHHYRIDIAPDLKQQTFTGRVTITGTIASPTASLWFNALGLVIDHCRVTAGDAPAATVLEMDDAAERLVLALARPLTGAVSVHIDYHGVLNDRMAGFYRSGFETEDGPAVIAVTQFQESDARRAFPCIDHPAAKAQFDISLVVDKDLCAISNMPVISRDPAGDGRERVVFARTPKMSTYLVFFSVGDYRIATDTADPRVRTAVLPGREPYGDFGREFGAKALDYCERYTGIPYPLEKMDLIAIPDFAFGAMENWGAITFRENLLLYDPEKTSSAGKERICEVTAHEVVHQWFGNLVTPSDWRYLWLNESFATYFGFGIVDHYYPEWETWHQFLNGQTGTAMKRDALPGTVAIEIPGGEHVVINSSTAPIIYNKGASILRHIRGYIGEAHFRKGLNAYLARHAYGNAASVDFWEAFESVSARPVTAIMKSWIAQPGFPLLDVTRERDHLQIRQQRFSYLPEPAEARWQVPFTIAFWEKGGKMRQETLLMTEAAMKVPLPGDTAAYKLNAGQTEFYRTRYRDAVNSDALERMAAAGQLSPEDRWGIQADLYELVKAGMEPLTRYLAFVTACSAESAFLPILGMSENLFEVFRIVSPPMRERVGETARRLVTGALAAIGTAPAPHEPQPLATLRDQLIWQGACYGDETARHLGKERFDSLIQGHAVHPDLMKSTLQAGAAHGDDQTLAWLIRRYEGSDSEHHRMDLLTAMGAFTDPALLEKALAFALDGVPDRIRFLLVAAVAANPSGEETLWHWFLTNRESLEKGHPLLYERMLIAIIAGAGLARPEAVQSFFLDYRSRPASPADAIDLALGKLTVNLRLRAAANVAPHGITP